MAWVAVAIGGATAIGKAIQANQTKQKNKGYISAASREATQKLGISQAYAREGGAESLNARGLAQGGTVNANPIHTALDANGMVKATGSPTTIGAQDQENMGTQMGLEQRDLQNQTDRANRENRDTYTESLIGAGVSGVNAAVGAHGAIADWQSGKAADAASAAAAGASGAAAGPDVGAAPGPSYTPTAAPAPVGPSVNPIHEALLNQHSAFGVNPNSPLDSGAWSTKPPRLASPGQTTASFTAE